MIIYQDEPPLKYRQKRKKKIKFEVDHVRPQTMLYDKRFSHFNGILLSNNIFSFYLTILHSCFNILQYLTNRKNR
jgi:hypothetical protein